MNRPKSYFMASPLAIKPMGIKSSVVSKNVADARENHDPEPSTPRVNSSSATAATKASTSTDITAPTATETVAGANESTKKCNDVSDKNLPNNYNVKSLVFDSGDLRPDLGPPDENHVPSPTSSRTDNKRKVTGKIPIFEIKKLHAFQKGQMPVYWNITNLKPNKVTRHLRCLLLALESRPTFSQIRPQYYQLRDHFVYSYGFLEIHSTPAQQKAKLQALYKLTFDKLHALLSLADRLEGKREDDKYVEDDDENRSEPSDVPERQRIG